MGNWSMRVDTDTPMVRRTPSGRVSDAGRKADEAISALVHDGQRRRMDVADLVEARRVKAQLMRAAKRANVAVVISIRDDGTGNGHVVWLTKGEDRS